MWWRDFLTIQWVVFRDQHPNKQSKSGESSNALYLLALQGKQYHFCNFVNIRRQSLRLVIFLRVNIRRQSLRLVIVLREGNGNPLQYTCLENPMGGGAW